jgi:hypothetical protein
MNRTDRPSAWELLLEEPVASVTSVRILSGSRMAAEPLRRGAAILTDTRFILVSRASPSRPPKSRIALDARIRLVFPRSNITGIDRIQGAESAYLMRYYDGSEKKLLFKPGKGGEDLILLMEQDLSGG